MFRGYSYVDPQKEISAMKDAVRSGFKTLADCVAENGGDLDELLIARQAELAKLDQMNIITDTDPSAVNGSGASNTSPSEALMLLAIPQPQAVKRQKMSQTWGMKLLDRLREIAPKSCLIN